MTHARVAILGAGFSGIGMAARLLDDGMDDFFVLERADDVGGTWRDNTYPGCQCDIPRRSTRFLAPNPDWTRVYPLQEEIRDYLRRVATERGVMPHIRFGHEGQGAAWDDEEKIWRLQTSRGELTANVLVTAMGGLSEPAPPEIPGIDRFGGTMFHSAEWDHDHDLAGERVAVIGTGASAIQIVPEISRSSGRCTCFSAPLPG